MVTSETNSQSPLASTDPDGKTVESVNPFNLEEILIDIGNGDLSSLFEPTDLESADCESTELEPANVEVTESTNAEPLKVSNIVESECESGSLALSKSTDLEPCEDVAEHTRLIQGIQPSSTLNSPEHTGSPEQIGQQQTPSIVDDLQDEFAALEAIINDSASSAAATEIPTATSSAANSYSSVASESELNNSKLNVQNYVRIASDEAKLNTQFQGRSYSSGIIRVDVSRIENLNNLVGELVTKENTTALQNQQIQSMIASIVQRFNFFEQIAKELQDWTDQSQKSTARLQGISKASEKHYENSELFDSLYGLREKTPAKSEPSEPLREPATAFDPLQMDSYSHLYTLVQAAIEEIAQQGEAMRDLMLISQQMQQTQQQKQQTLKQVRNDLLWVRMLPVGEILQRFPRMVRDISAKYEKQIIVKLSGTDTLVDKVILEKLFDPLIHLVRNAVDHGIELPEVRVSKGKCAQATIEIRAFHRSNQIYIEVQDDGRGIDVERIRARVVALNWATVDEADEFSNEQLYEYLFSPGFSTAARVNEISGRGVGLDAVKVQVKNLKGSISLASEPGKGTIFTMRFPLAMNVADLLVFSIRSNLMAIAVDSLVSIVSAPPDQIQIQADRKFYQWQDQLVPLYPQHLLLQHYPLPRQANETFQAIPLPQNDMALLLLVATESKIVALQVDEILQNQEFVIKPFGAAVTPPAFLAGCTILGDGSLIPVINGQALEEGRQDERSDGLNAGKTTEVAEAVSVHTHDHELNVAITTTAPIYSQACQIPEIDIPEIDRSDPTSGVCSHAAPIILVVDDSLTARQMLAFTLEKAGYRVVQARDGQDALHQLRQQPDIQAVFCDVEMPRMNGFEFLNHCRKELPDSYPPVIMVTSRSGDKHRQMAYELGAKFYLTKPYLEQALLNTLQRCLTEETV